MWLRIGSQNHIELGRLHLVVRLGLNDKIKDTMRVNPGAFHSNVWLPNCAIVGAWGKSRGGNESETTSTCCMLMRTPLRGRSQSIRGWGGGDDDTHVTSVSRRVSTRI